MRRQAIAQCAEARRQHINRSKQGSRSSNTPLTSFDNKSNTNNPMPTHLYQTIPFLHDLRHSITTLIIGHHRHHTANTFHHRHHKLALQIPKVRWSNTYNSHHDPCITEQYRHPSTTIMLTPANFSCVMKMP
jgi:hypothetical protein